MPYFAVIVERGERWDWSRPLREQHEWEAHAALMDALADDNFIVVGGPLGDEDRAQRILHIVNDENEASVRTRLAQDPWYRDGTLRIVSVEPWTVLLGGFVKRKAATGER